MKKTEVRDQRTGERGIWGNGDSQIMLYTKGFQMKLNCRFDFPHDFIPGITLASHNAFESNRISYEAVLVLFD